ncbi:helix-turn-helix transcriptional regulator [Pseudonocardia sp. GCM10023141]|uniref:helix-turn-helix transcriptional regulator n=1 Tax=Pseudonocardia sp. GCM10023141 TaxID=3252653 RepID=UPI00360D4147
MAATVVSPVLVGRSVEQAALQAAYDRSRAGHAITVVVSGEAGIGKSRLVTAVIEQLPGDPLVLVGGCLELGTDGAPFVPFVAILRDLLRRWDRERVDALLRLEESALAALLPDLPAPRVAHGRTRLLEEFRTLVERAAATGPVVLVVEDLHWADPSSRELFAYLARNLVGCGVLLVGTVRTGELVAGHPVRALLTEVGRRADVVVLPLPPLAPGDVAALLTAIRGAAAEPAQSRRIHRRSGGNPLFVEALSGADGASEASLRMLLLDRVAELPEPARALLAVVAVAGSAVADDVLAVVSDLPVTDRQQALRVLIERDQLRIHADGYTIRHDLIREAVGRALLPGERRELHRRYADALAGDPGAGAALAEHWAAAGEPERAVTAAWQAAARARAYHAFDEDLALLERVLGLWEHVADPAALIGAGPAVVHELAATAALAAGSSAAGVAHCTAALALLDRAAEPERAARMLGLRGTLQRRLDGRGRQDLETAVALVPADADRTRAELLSALAFASTSDGRADDARHQATAALRIGDRLADPALRAPALLVLGAVEADLDASRRLFAECRGAADAEDDHHTYLTSLQWEATALTPAGQYAAAAELARSGLESARRHGHLRSRGSMLAETLAGALVALGRWDEALEVVDDALAEDPPAYFVRLLDVWRANVALHRGETERADRLIDALAADLPPETQGHIPIVDLQIRRALQRGDTDQADQLLAMAMASIMDGATLTYERLTLAVTGAEVVAAWRAAHPRDRRVAVVLGTRLAELRALVRANPYRTSGAAAQVLTFEALTGSGALTDWDRAAAAWRGVGNPLELAGALIGGAAAALASSNRSGARQRLREAGSVVDGLGAVPLRRRVDELAVRARLEDPQAPTDPAARFGLTRRELQVLQVLAGGRSNAEIAAALFISTNTVASHVARILTKLGAGSRTEAVALAHRDGLLS